MASIKRNVFLCWGNQTSILDEVPNISVSKVELNQSETEYFGCALDDEGVVHCWGDNTYDIQNVPAGVFQQLSVGMRTVCALNELGQVHCWGDDSCFQNYTPVGEYRHVDTSDCHTCGIKNDGSIYCWGDLNTDYTELYTPPEGDNYTQIGMGATMDVF